MRAFLYADPRKPHQVDAMQSAFLGLKRHGIHIANELDDADFSVWWNDRAPPSAKDRPYLVLEAGYINGQSGEYRADRLKFISTGWDGLHGRANSLAPDCPPDRWKALGIRMQNWRVATSQYHALLLDQVPGDVCAPGPDTKRRIREQAEQTWHRVTVRSHPLVRIEPPLLEQLIDVDVAVTWASTAAVECVIAGVPCVTLDRGSIAWPVTSHSINEPLRFPDRAQWAYNLAYRQWTHDELEDGSAWEWLQDGIDQHYAAGGRADQPGNSEGTPAHHA